MTRLLTTTALLGALALPAQAFDLTDMSDAERAAFRAEIRNYLLENPDVIMEAVAVLEERQQADAAQNDEAMLEANKAALFDDGFSHVGGNPEGDVTIVEFIDYRCGYCRRAHDEVAQLIAGDGNIRLITKEFPILGPNSTASSKFAIAVKHVAGGEAYEAANEALIRLNGEMSPKALRRLADTLGVDADAVIAKMESEDVAREINETRALAQRLQINGTPTFVVESQMLRGYLPLQAMQEIVARVRAEG
ncbi:DsbA family protein [Primorskyibacter sp. S187A]|uniref:DsbA family protein n=1 Tax=Primorskyibacter sp. S187A TaxID=3415130 RepID=UPI003C7B589A